ncbi:MAG: S41 family peptidase [Actinomycetota bacterium]
MDRWQKISIVALSALVAALGVFALGFSMGDRRSETSAAGAGGEQTDGFSVVRDAFGLIRTSAVDPPGDDELARGAVKGMIRVVNRSGDPYAFFYTPSGYESFQELTTGRFSGIGVWLKEKAEDLEIVSVLPSTPALEAGLKRGDIVEAIDGRAVADMSVDEAVARIKGKPGTDVAVDVSRDGAPLDFTITRRSIEFPNLVSRVTDEDIGYIRLLGFARGAGQQLRREVSELSRDGAEGIVLDLRDNGGGLFSEGIDVASVFLDDGKIVSYKARSEPERVYEAEGAAFEEIPLVVLVNEGTASASEIVAGALQDRDRAILVGEETYGKGSVQDVFPLPDASALKLTTGAYFTPDGRNITGDGIEPDVEVAASRTAQRDRAVEILRGIVISTTGAQG